MSNETTINTFEDAVTKYLESILRGRSASVLYREDGTFDVNFPDDESHFAVQVCPVDQLSDDVLQGGLFIIENPAPRVEIDGEEYVILRQW